MVHSDLKKWRFWTSWVKIDSEIHLLYHVVQFVKVIFRVPRSSGGDLGKYFIHVFFSKGFLVCCEIQACGMQFFFPS